MQLTDNQKSELFPAHLFSNRNHKAIPENETGMTLIGENGIANNNKNMLLKKPSEIKLGGDAT